MNVTRYITWYDKKTKKHVGEYCIDQIIVLEELEKIIKKHEDDPKLYKVYDLNETEVRFLNKNLNLDFDFKNFLYNLDCYQSDR